MKANFSVRSLLLVFAVLFTTFPVLLFGIFEVIEEFKEGNAAAAEMNRRSAVLIQQEIKGSLDQCKALLEGLALEIDHKTLQARDPKRLKALLADYPKVLGIVVSNAKAISEVAYSLTIDVRTGVDYSDRPQIIQARATKRTSISGNLQGRATNIAAVVIVVPLLDENDEIEGFFAGSVAPDMLATSGGLGPDEYGAVVDSYGRIVVANTGNTSMTRPQLDAMAKELAASPDGPRKFPVGGMDVDIQVLTIDPIGWKVFVGVAPEFLTAHSMDAVRRTAILSLICAAIGVLIMAVVSVKTARGIADVGAQLERMSALELQPIGLSGGSFLPTELRKLIDNFNELLERTARAKLAQLEAISRVADSILITSPDGGISYVNEAGIRTFGDVIGRNLKDLLDRHAIVTVFQDGRMANEWKGEVSVRKPDGSAFDGFLSTTPVLDNGRVRTVVAIIQDITTQKAARESLTQSEKMITLGELVAGTSHELNNPLAIVTGYSDLLLEEEGLTSEQRSKVESIRKNALRASSVVHSLLAFARKRKPERVTTDVNKVVLASVDLKDYDLKTSGIQFERTLDPALPPVFADPNQLQQVLLNVINNAQDAVMLGSESPRIVLRTQVRADTVLITVEDNGPGISKSDLKKVFDPFFTTKPVGKGTGLGLSISYGIIREHNGDIFIHSEVGSGTQVTIELPVDRGEVRQEDRPVPLTTVARSMRLLVVDDETDIVTILRKGLTRPGVTVDSAVTIADALSLASTILYDFVLTDVKMPGGSGIDLYKRLCENNSAYERRTVFLTGDTSNPDTVQFLEERGLTYFSKPFDFQVMERYLRQAATPGTR